MNPTINKTIVLAALILMSFATTAGTTNNTGNSPLVKQISKNMNFPKNLVLENKATTQVRVSFKLNEKGEKEILVVNGPTEELKQFVVASILKTQFNTLTETNKEYNVVFNFKQI